MSILRRRRGLLVAALGTPLLAACPSPRFFDLRWDEEVQLHDGRVIVVKLRYTYERLGGLLSFDRYDPSILRTTEISFNAGQPIGEFTQVFERHRVDIVEHFDDKWYVLLETRGSPLTLNTGSGWKEDWGSSENSAGQKCWSLSSVGLARASINDVPEFALKVNVLMDYAPARELVAFDGTRVTMAKKTLYAQKYPLDPPRMKIERPPLIMPRVSK